MFVLIYVKTVNDMIIGKKNWNRKDPHDINPSFGLIVHDSILNNYRRSMC